MVTTAEAFRVARQHYQAGRFAQADQICEQITRIEATFADAWDLRGLIARSVGNPQAAIEFGRRAIAICPHDAYFHNNLAAALHDSGDSGAALLTYQHAIRLKPDLVEPHLNSGHVFSGQGRIDEAITCYRNAIELDPDAAEGHAGLGGIWEKCGRIGDAIACYRRALGIAPDAANHMRLGAALLRQREIAEAVACFREAVRQMPDSANAHNSLGAALLSLQSFDEAINCFCRAIALKADHAIAHHNLGTTFKELGRLDEAIPHFRQALAIAPHSTEVYVSLGSVLRQLDRRQEAASCFERAIQLDPRMAGAYMNLGNVRLVENKLTEALDCYQKTLQLDPECMLAHYNAGMCFDMLGEQQPAIQRFREALLRQPDFLPAYTPLLHLLMQCCDWEGVAPLAARITAAVDEGCTDIDPWRFLALNATPAQQQRCACQAVELLCGHAMQLAPREGFTFVRSEKPRIRLGYLSSDFRQHATGVLIAELIEQHDRSQFDVLAYSHGPSDDSPMERRLRNAFDEFVDIREMTYVHAARRIFADRIDILIDLNGHTRLARTPILALRPAPIQVNYLGYPGTMGAPFIDYMVVDTFVIPPGQRENYTEKLVYLPGCYQPNDRQRRIASDAGGRVEHGLPADGFVFCCFNNSYKITPPLFDAWMRLLQANPGSVLWLLEWNASVPVNLRKQAQNRGVAPERLVFAPRIRLDVHLARHQFADLLLDTFPISGHTAASDALWSGLPVLTLAGDTFASRVAGSLLHGVGLPELVATTLDEYERLAMTLAESRDKLSDLRRRLRENRDRSSLFHGASIARQLEDAYRQMWRIFAANEIPRDISVQTQA